MYASTTLVVLLAVISVSYVAEAKKYTDADLKPLFAKYDADKSGELSLKEVEALGAALGEPKAKTDKNFKDGDKDKNGSITYDEFKAEINKD